MSASSTISDSLDDYPLFTSLYPEETPLARVKVDYTGLFPQSKGVDIAMFEAEVLFHYSTNHVVMKSIDTVVEGNPSAQDYARVRDALLASDLSTDLSNALSQP